jgi:hypothetical protein
VAKKTRARVFESRIASGDAATSFTSVKLKCGVRATRPDCTKYNRTGKGNMRRFWMRVVRLAPKDPLCPQSPVPADDQHEQGPQSDRTVS